MSSNTVEVPIPLDAEAARALESPARRAAAGRYLSGLLKGGGGRVRDLLEEALSELQQEAHSRGLTQQDIDAELEAWRSERKT